jgi:hypothetical protein
VIRSRTSRSLGIRPIRFARSVLVAASAIVACAPAASDLDEPPVTGLDEPPTTNDLDEELSRGQVDTTNRYPWVVRIPGCTASKIEERKFLTAAHCVSRLEIQNGKYEPVLHDGYRLLPAPFFYSKKRVEPQEGLGAFDRRLNVVSVTLHPSWKGGVALPSEPEKLPPDARSAYLKANGGKDAAIITVDRPDADVPFEPILGTKAVPAPGSIVTVVGAGREQPAVSGWRVKFGSKQVITRPEMESALELTHPAYQMLAHSFFTKRYDSVGLPTNDTYAGTEFGDSGGPVFQGGRIVGINSSGVLSRKWDQHLSTAAIAGWLRTPGVVCATEGPHKRPPYNLAADGCDCGPYQRWEGDRCVDDASDGCFVDRSRSFQPIVVADGVVRHPGGPEQCGREYPALFRLEDGTAKRTVATADSAAAPVDAQGNPIDVFAWVGIDRDRRRDILYRTVDALVERLSAPSIPKVIPVETSYGPETAKVTSSFNGTLAEVAGEPDYYPESPPAGIRCDIKARRFSGPTRWLTYKVRFSDGVHRGLEVIVERPFDPRRANMARFEGHVGKVYVSFNFGKNVYLIPPGFSRWLRNVPTSGDRAVCQVRQAQKIDGTGPGIDHCDIDSVSRTLTVATTTGSPVELPSLWLPSDTFAIAVTTLNHTRYENLAGNIGRDLVLMARQHSMSRTSPAVGFERATASHWLRAPTIQSGDVQRIVPRATRGGGYYTLSVFPNAVQQTSHKVSIAAKVYSPSHCGAPQTCFGAAGSNCTSPNAELPAAGLCLPAAGETKATCFVSGLSQLHDQCCSLNPSETGCGGAQPATKCGAFLNAAAAEFAGIPLEALKGLLTNGAPDRRFWRETFSPLDISFSNATNQPGKRLLAFDASRSPVLVRRDAGFRAPNGTTFGNSPAVFNGPGETGQNWCKTAAATPPGSANGPFTCGRSSRSSEDPTTCFSEGRSCENLPRALTANELAAAESHCLANYGNFMSCGAFVSLDYRAYAYGCGCTTHQASERCMSGLEALFGPRPHWGPHGPVGRLIQGVRNPVCTPNPATPLAEEQRGYFGPPMVSCPGNVKCSNPHRFQQSSML